MASLPYVTAPGNISKALRGIKTAATPESVSQDFVKTILKIPGGSGDQITSFLKKIGLAGSDGKPTDRYRRFRNSGTTGAAAAEALRDAFSPLYVRNEYLHKLSDDDIKGLIVEETGAAEDSTVPGLVLAAINALREFANFEATSNAPEQRDVSATTVTTSSMNIPPANAHQGVGMNLSYTINLNLPATSDIAVFNAIFKSLKDNILRSANE